MRKITLFLCALLISALGFAQGHETFENFESSGTSYSDGTFTGQDGVVWTYNRARGDIEIAGKALTLHRDGNDAYLESAEIPNGIGTLEFSYMQAFGGDVNLDVYVNDDLVATLTSDGEQDVVKSSGTITVEVEGDFVLKFDNSNGRQVAIDDIIWTAYEESNNGGTDGYVEIGPYEDGSTTNLPIYALYDYSFSQQIVYSSEINAEGDITGISFRFVSGSQDNREKADEWTMYLGHTSKSSFDNNDDWIAVSELTEVFEGTITYSEPDEMMQITFDTPFTYNGNDNLVIATLESKNGWGSLSFSKAPTIPNSNRSMYFQRDNTQVDPEDLPTATSRLGYVNYMHLEGIQQTCPLPSDVVFSDITPETANVSWTENGSATLWNLQYGPQGFELGSGTIETGLTTEEFSLTGLSANTAYDVYIQSDCGDETSNWSNSFTLVTGCDVVDVPYLEDFENAVTPELPNCSSIEVISGNAWKTINSASNFNGKVLNYSYHYSEEADSWFFTGGINLDENETYLIKYKFGASSTSWPENLKVAYGTSAEASAMTNEIADHIDIVSFEENEVAFTVDVTGIYYFGFQAHSDANQNQLYLDDISIDLAPTCLVVTDPMVENITTNSADLSWTEGGDETQWIVRYGDVIDFDMEDNSTYEEISVNDDPEVSLSDLESNTDYVYYVQSVCGEDDESQWAGPYSFATLCGAVNVPYVENFNNVSFPNIPNCTAIEVINGAYNGEGWRTISAPGNFDGGVLAHNWSSVGSGNLDSWFFTAGLNLEAGVEYELKFKYANNSSSSTFTERINVAFGTAPEASSMDNEIDEFTFSSLNSNYEEFENTFTVDADGVYYIGIQASSDEDQYSLYIDDISVDSSDVLCSAVTNVSISEITDTTATVTWDEASNATEGYIVEVYEEGAEQGTDTPVLTETVAAGTTTIEIDGLTPETEYDVYVISDCGEDVIAISEVVGFVTVIDDIVIECEWTVIVEEDYFGDEVEWELREEDGTVLLSGGPYYDFYYYDVQTVTAAGPLEFYITSDGEFGDNTPSYSVSNGTEVLVEGILSMGGDTMVYSDLNCDGESSSDDCEAVSNVAVTDITSTEATITWDESTTATEGYVIEIYEEGAEFGTDTPMVTETVAPGTTTIEIDGLTPETEYDVYVISDCGDDNTAVSDVVSFTTGAFDCEAAADVAISNISADSATVTWTASSTAVNGYTVDVYENNADPSVDTPVFTETVADDVTTVDVDGLTPETTYNVYVTADCSNGITTVSDVVSFTTEPTTGVGDFDILELEIYPNPTTADLNIITSKVIEEVQVYNLLGQLVLTVKPNASIVTIDVSELSTATYLLTIHAEDVVKTIRFVKK